MRDRRGFTLVEAVVALALVTAVGVSVSMALVASRAAAVHDRNQAIGRVAAQARLSTLTSLAFHTIAGANGAAVAITDTTTDVSGDPPGPGGDGTRPVAGRCVVARQAGLPRLPRLDRPRLRAAGRCQVSGRVRATLG